MARRGQRPRAEPAAPLPATIQTAEDLEQHVAALIAIEPRFAAISLAAGELPIRRIASGFAGLVWLITGQQISTAAARAIFARTQATLGTLTAEAMATVDDEALKAAGQSTAKIRSLRAVSSAILAGEVMLDSLAQMEAEDAIAHLVTIKGIGRWTAEVYLLFALGHPDIFPAGDLALREAARAAFAMPERPQEKVLVALAEAWRPHRSAAARLLWAHYGALKRGDVTPA
jgi:DNA-3-methyladenine glycosylase II